MVEALVRRREMIIAVILAAVEGVALGVALVWLACTIVGMWLGWRLLHGVLKGHWGWLEPSAELTF
jgi:hypothetical protein